MKVARFVLKIVAASLAAAALVCCIIAYWDKIVEVVEAVRTKLCKAHDPDFADYADWDD